jgi:hypothetical protein
MISDGQVESEKKINLYDNVTRHYHVINSVTGALARRFVCEGCNKECERGVMQRCQETCSDCMSVPPCSYAVVRIPCESCNR